MRHRFTANFERAYAEAPEAIRRAFNRKLVLLLNNWRHPSLQSHPWPAHGPDAMQARINLDWRFYYRTVEGDVYEIYWMQHYPKSTQRGR